MRKTPNFITLIQDKIRLQHPERSSMPLRFLAGIVGVDAGTLSKYISGKQLMTMPTARRIANQIQLSEIEQSQFFHAVIEHRTLSRLREDIYRNSSFFPNPKNTYTKLADTISKEVSD